MKLDQISEAYISMYESANIVKHTDFKTWRSELNKLGGDSESSENEKKHTAYSHHFAKIGEFDTRKNEGWLSHN